jgi:hypothetical protein
MFDYYDDVADYADYRAEVLEEAGWDYDWEEFNEETGWADIEKNW